MKLLKRMFDSSRNLDGAIRIGAGIGLAFGAIGAVLYSLGRFVLAVQPGNLPLLFDYGYLAPVANNLLIFGGFFGVFLALCFSILKDSSGVTPRLAPAACLALLLYILGLLVGIIGILAGANSGREFGELSWPADELYLLSILAALAAMIDGFKQSGKFDLRGVLAVGGLSGMLSTWLIGNLALPYGLFSAVSPFTGMQDQAVQEVYRLGVLVYFIVIPILTGLYFAIPKFYGLRDYSAAMTHFGLGATAVVLPLAAAGALVFSAAPGLLQNLGVAGAIALGAAILSLSFGAHYSFTRGATRVRSNHLGMALRWSAALISVFAVVRILSAFPSVQAQLGYTALDLRNIMIDASIYGILGMSAIGVLIYELNLGRSSPLAARRVLMISGGLAVLVLLLTFSLQGITQALHLSAMEGEALAHKEWVEANARGSLLEKPATTPLMTAGSPAPEPPSEALRIAISFPGFELAGSLLVALCALAGAFAALLARLGSRPYTTYSFNTGVARSAGQNAAGHGAH
ncbi:MAG: hypothetical protein K1X75_04345 [Leptospirales bacterium]|nr:hypothetical protein [Leptospirales bacterium]